MLFWQKMTNNLVLKCVNTSLYFHHTFYGPNIHLAVYTVHVSAYVKNKDKNFRSTLIAKIQHETCICRGLQIRINLDPIPVHRSTYYNPFGPHQTRLDDRGVCTG
jgi:hypothetical protein